MVSGPSLDGSPLLDGNWQPWSTWETCEDGIESVVRFRLCNPLLQGGIQICPFAGSATENKKCPKGESKIKIKENKINIDCLDGHWAEWASWSSCNQGQVKRKRARNCQGPKFEGKAVCPEVGSATEQEDCPRSKIFFIKKSK